VARLQAGQSIWITESTHGQAVPKGLIVGIIFGETELDIAAQLRKQGLVGPETEVTVAPQLGS